MNERGATQWTMAKLMTLVLAIAVLVLIIYGVQNKGFGPLKENIEGRFNSVLILLGVRDTGEVTCGESFVQKINGVGSGKFFPCTNNCTFIPDKGIFKKGMDGFKVDKEGFQILTNKLWMLRSDVLSDRDLSFYRDFYEESMTFVMNESGYSFKDMDKTRSDDFVLCDNFCTSSKVVGFIGRLGGNVEGSLLYDGKNFRVEKERKDIYTGDDVDEAVDVFYSVADIERSVNDWNIKYVIGVGSQEKDLSNLESLNPILNDNQLDSKVEAEALKSLFIKWNGERKHVSEEGVKDLRDKFEGKKMRSKSGEEYTISVDFKNGESPYLVFTSKSRKPIALGYIGSVLSEVHGIGDWLPLGLYEQKDGGWTFIKDNRFYKLSSEDFKEIGMINKIYQHFNLRRCVQ